MSFFLGSNPARWASGVPTYSGLVWRGLYPGITVSLIERGGEPAFILHSQRSSGWSAFNLRVAGATRLWTRDGQLVAETAIGEVHLPLVLHQGRRLLPRLRGHDVTFEKIASPVVSMHPNPPSPAQPRAGLRFGTFLGSLEDDSSADIAMGSDGSMYVIGSTDSIDFPSTPGAFDQTFDGADAFVAKFDPSGSTLLYSTALGGSEIDHAHSLAVASDGSVYVGGSTGSSDFPTTPGAFSETRAGLTDAFITKLDPAGGSLVFSTFLGGTGHDDIQALTASDAGVVYATGDTMSTQFPTTPGAFDRTINNGTGGSNDAFVTSLSPSGDSLAYSTYLGGGDNDFGRSIALAPDGSAYVTGETRARNFPTTPGAFDRTYNGGNSDVFVTRVAGDGSALMSSTFVGGDDDEIGSGIQLGLDGSIYVVGDTSSPDYPTTPGAYDRTLNSVILSDVLLTRLDPQAVSLVFSTFLGGDDSDDGADLVVEGDGAVTIVGSSESEDFPTTPGAFDRGLGGSADVTVSRFDPKGGTLLYSSFLGGTSAIFDGNPAMTAATPGSVTLTGLTFSDDFPTTPGAYDLTLNGGSDVFLATLEVAHTVHVRSVNAGYRQAGEGYEVAARVRIAWADGRPASGARVTVLLTDPAGRTLQLRSDTGSEGMVVLARETSLTGTYTFTVRSIADPPAVYDPTANLETSDSVTIP